MPREFICIYKKVEPPNNSRYFKTQFYFLYVFRNKKRDKSTLIQKEGSPL